MQKATYLIGQRIRIKKITDSPMIPLNMLEEPNDYMTYVIISKRIERSSIIYHVAANNIPQNFILININDNMFYKPESSVIDDCYPVYTVLD